MPGSAGVPGNVMQPDNPVMINRLNTATNKTDLEDEIERMMRLALHGPDGQCRYDTGQAGQTFPDFSAAVQTDLTACPGDITRGHEPETDLPAKTIPHEVKTNHENYRIHQQMADPGSQ